MTTTGTRPDGRYGAPRAKRSRRATALLAAGGVVAGILVAFLAYRNLGSAPIEAERAAFSAKQGNRMELTFDVRRQEPDRAAVCVVRVRAIDGLETGRKEVLVPPGGSSTRVSTVIRGTREPVTADVFGCSYQVPEYLSTSGPPSG